MGIIHGGKTTKIHAIVDGLGNPLLLKLTGGNVHDSRPVCDMLDLFKIAGSNIFGDKAYGSKSIRDYITAHNACYTIPPKANTQQP
ncbi:transposase [Shimazuella kribbensis]|uniref:transposase n=1 Tax=Shimazuella kribbensis TaxID=139808 RepID=UPI000A02E050